MNKSYQNFKKRVGKLAVTFALVGTTAAGGMAVATDSVDAATVKSGYTSTTVTLRKSASTKSAKLTTIKKGAKVTILKTSGKWLKVKYNGKTGYVYKTYVKKTFTTKDYSGKFKLKTDLNVRKGPGTSFVKAGTLKKGTVVTVKGKTSNGWYTITYKGSTRYISASSKYLTKYVAPTPKPDPKPDPTPTPKPDPTPTPEPEKNNAPTISVNDTYTLVKGEDFDYSMLKATASDKEDGDLTSKIDFSGVVNTGKVGEYTVKLTVKDSKGATATKTVKVVVKKAEIKDNQAPVISVKDTYSIGLKSEFKYEDLGAVAYDKEDGDLTIVYGGDTVNTSKVGTYKVTLTATDSLGAKTTKTVEVKVIANVKPVITCPDTYTIEQGKTFDYALLKATAKDFEDGDLTKSIVFSGDKVSTVYSGKTFKITLTVKDSKGAEAVKDVTVKVVPDKDPVITANNVSIEQGDVLDKDTLVKLSGLKADDGNGNDITSAVEFIGLDKVNTNVKEGTSYDVYAKVVDNGESKTKKITITITKNEGPVISNIKFNGKDVKDNKVTIKQYSDFNLNMFKATATKNKETYPVTFEGNVDIKTVGDYTVKAIAKDSKGKVKVVEIKVRVEKYTGSVDDGTVVDKKPILTVPNKVELNYAESKDWKQSEVLQKITEKINATATEVKDTNKKLDVKYNEDDLRAVKINDVGGAYKVRVSAESKEYKGEVTEKEVIIIIVNHDK